MQNYYERERQVLANRLAREQADRAMTANRRSAEMAADNARRNAARVEQARQQQQIRQANERQRQSDQRAAQVEKEQRRRQRDRNTQYPGIVPGLNSSSSLPAAPLGGGVASPSRGTTRVYPPSRPIRKSNVAGALLAIVVIFAYCVAKGPKASPAPTPGESGSSQVHPSAPADSTNNPAPTPRGDALK
jgi:hypothetical protein